MYKYKFSVVMAVYNVEKYLHESVESLVQQDIGFKDHVQLIMVDDGSTDDSGRICDYYKALYPDNVTVIHKENGGVSSARNEGLKHIEGRYVNFLDSDDLLEEKTLSKVYDYFLKVENEVNMVSVPLIFIEGKSGSHVLNYKYHGTEGHVNDLEKDYSYIQLQISSTFWKHEAAKQISFDTRLAYAEDAKVLQKLFLRHAKYGAVPAAAYYYRVRNAADSAISVGKQKKGWYLDYLKYFTRDIIKESMDIHGKVPKHIQYVLMYDLQWRFKVQKTPKAVLAEEERAEYLSVLGECLQYIEDSIILEQKYIKEELKEYIVYFKHRAAGDAYRKRKCPMTLDKLELTPEGVLVEGTLETVERRTKPLKVTLQMPSKEEAVTNNTSPHKPCARTFWDEPLWHTQGFQFLVPYHKIKGLTKLTFEVQDENGPMEISEMKIGTHVPLSGRYYQSYYYDRGYLVCKRKKELWIEPAGMVKCFAREGRLWMEIFKKPLDADKKKLLKYRLSAFLRMFRKEKEVWVISDRLDKAGDNGEAFFRYLTDKKPNGVSCYFAIQKKANAYERIAKMGPVLDPDTEAYKEIFLQANRIISSQAAGYVTNPFNAAETSVLKDIIRRKQFVFLQHGVILHDLSDGLFRSLKDIDLFVTSTKGEYQSILDCDYFYTEKEVKLTGLPRFDRLEDQAQNIITVMPTWRSQLVTGEGMEIGNYRLLPGFEESDFYKMYQKLLGDQIFAEQLNKAGYTLQVMMHPNMTCALPAFTLAAPVVIANNGKSYQEVYKESKMIVTDYSSAVFDFAYLRKPVLYYQTDRDEMFSGNHTFVKGYFDYEKDGFGEVCDTAEELKQTILAYVEQDCRLKEMYRERIEATFPNNDKNNCQRVFDAIINTPNR